MQLEPTDVLRCRRMRGPLEKRSKPLAAVNMAPLRPSAELACIHVLDHALAQRGDGVRTHGKLLSWMRSKHLDPQDRPHGPLSAISHLVTAPAAGSPLQRSIAQRFSPWALPLPTPSVWFRCFTDKPTTRHSLAHQRNPA